MNCPSRRVFAVRIVAPAAPTATMPATIIRTATTVRPVRASPRKHQRADEQDDRAPERDEPLGEVDPLVDLVEHVRRSGRSRPNVTQVRSAPDADQRAPASTVQRNAALRRRPEPAAGPGRRSGSARAVASSIGSSLMRRSLASHASRSKHARRRAAWLRWVHGRPRLLHRAAPRARARVLHELAGVRRGLLDQGRPHAEEPHALGRDAARGAAGTTANPAVDSSLGAPVGARTSTTTTGTTTRTGTRTNLQAISSWRPPRRAVAPGEGPAR